MQAADREQRAMLEQMEDLVDRAEDTIRIVNEAGKLHPVALRTPCICCSSAGVDAEIKQQVTTMCKYLVDVANMQKSGDRQNKGQLSQDLKAAIHNVGSGAVSHAPKVQSSRKLCWWFLWGVC